MKLRWNARADAAASIVLWLGTLIAALICIVWFVKNLSPDHINLQQIDNELTQLQRDLNTACRMHTYQRNYYPKVNSGSLILNGIQVCIDSSPCRVVFYRSNSTGPVIAEQSIVLNDSYPCTSIESCNVLYYSSDEPPVWESDTVRLERATICENRDPPIRRCRLLTCNMNNSFNVALDRLTFINITKTENGTYTLQPE